jgi:RNA polymerase sigma factor (sigma-70 family)
MAAPDDPPSTDPGDLVRHGRFVKALARELARDESEADELAARTMAEAVARRPGGGPSLRVWLRRVLWRIFRRERRNEERRRRASDSMEANASSRDSVPATVDLVARIELEHAIAAAFAALDEPYKSTLFLRFFDDLTPSQMAAQTGTPVETVKTRLKRGLASLRTRLDAELGGRGEGGRNAAIGDWRAVALALAKHGGPVVAVAKAKSLVAAAVVVVVAGFALWESSPRAVRRDASVAISLAPEPGMASARAAAPSQAIDEVASTSTVTRSEEPGATPFASGLVVDSDGRPLSDVRVVPSLVVEQFDGQSIATPLDLTQVERASLATTSDDGCFRVAHAPRNIAGLRFFKPGYAVDEWFELSARHEENLGHRVVLAPAARVHGRVVDTSRRPIPLASIDVHPFHVKTISSIAAAAEGAPTFVRAIPWSGHSTQTDGDGRFAIDSVNEVPCWCWVNAAGYLDFSEQHELVERDTELEVVLRRSAAVLVDVRDARTKAPVRIARALSYDSAGRRLEELHLPYEEWLGREWDGKPRSPPGRLTIWCERFTHDLKQPGSLRTLKVVVFAEGYRPSELSLVLKHDEEPPHETLELEPREPVPVLAGTITGASAATLELRFDQPWSNPDIQNSPPLARAEVGADGRFAFHDLPPATYRLSGTSPGRAPIWCDVTSPRDDLSLRFDPTARLVARVVDAAGAAAPGEVVVLQAIDEQRAWSAVAGPDGCARFEGLPAGSFDVLAHPPIPNERSDAPARTTRAMNYLRDERITLVAGENGPIDVPKLERRAVTLHLAFSDGLPVADASLERLSGEKGPVNWAYHESERTWKLDLRTDDDGFVDVDLYPGLYQTTVLAGEIQSYSSFTVPRRGDDPIEIEFGAPRRFGVLQGRIVTTPGGRPVAGWSVGAYAAGLHGAAPIPKGEVVTSAVTTDADGRFRIDRCPIGPIVVGARDPSMDNDDRPLLDRVTSAHVHFELEKDQERELTIRIPQADGAAPVDLDVEVTSADDGRPIPRVQVLVNGTFGDAEYYLMGRSLPTDESGRLRQRLLACDRYRVRLYPPGDRGDGRTPWKPFDAEVVPVDGVLRVRAALERAESR